jgi:hypothetical protein
MCKMAYDGKVRKSLNERAKEFGLALDFPSNNRSERRKELKSNIKEERRKKAIREGRKPYEEREVSMIQKRHYGTRKKYFAAVKDFISKKKEKVSKEKVEETKNG